MSQIDRIKRQIARLHEQLVALSFFQDPPAVAARPMGMFEGLLEIIAEHGNAIEVLETLSDQKDARLLELESRLGQVEDQLTSSD